MQLLSTTRKIHRLLTRHPTFTLMTLATLALGIGANVAVFSVVDAVLLEPLPYDDPERLVGLWHEAPGLGFDLVEQCPATYFTYREEGRSFVDVGLWTNDQVSITGRAEPEEVDALRLTGGTLPLLGVEPVLGRVFSPDDDLPASERTVILSYEYWQERFGGDPEVLGKTLTADGHPRRILGVMPRGFEVLNERPAIYLPYQLDRSQARMSEFNPRGLARLRPGVTLEQANADIARMIPMAVENFPGGLTQSMLDEARFGPNVRPLEADVIGDVGTSLWILLGTVGIVLLIACANVANLFLIRAEGRQQEVAVRRALGAGRQDVLRDFLFESVLLAAIGGALGVALAAVGLRFLIALGPTTLPRLSAIGLDATVLVFALGVTLLTGVLLGLVPALHLGKTELAPALKEGGRGSGDGRSRQRFRHALIVTQTAMALVLMAGAGLMVRSFQALQRVEPGFTEPHQVLTFRLSIPSTQIEEPEAVLAAEEEILRRLGEIPGVESVSAVTAVTMAGNDNNDALYVESFPVPEGQLPPIRRFKFVAGGYFETLGNPVIAGRSITWDDIHQRRPVAVITENLARTYWPDPRQALGERVRESALAGEEGSWKEIVGVVGNEHDDGVDQAATEVVYWPMASADFWGGPMIRRSLTYVMRTPRARQVELLQEVQQAVWSINRNLPLAEVRTLDEILTRSMARTTFTLVMLGIAALIALLLGVVGIYGVTSYTVAQRRREIGVRMAFGADRDDVRRLILRRSLALGVIGIAVGLLATFGLTRLMSSLLFGVEAMDPLTLGLVALALLATALFASSLPAARAARTDPIEALRWE